MKQVITFEGAKLQHEGRIEIPAWAHFWLSHGPHSYRHLEDQELDRTDKAELAKRLDRSGD